MIFKVENKILIKCTLVTISKMLNITFQVKGQGQTANELKLFFYRLFIVGSSFKM